MTDLSRLVKVEWSEVSIWDVGRRVHVQYSREQRFDVGTLIGIGSDTTSLTLYLAHGAQPGVMWNKQYSQVPDPTLYFLPDWADEQGRSSAG